MALAGAGGGGFLYMITKDTNSKNLIRNLIMDSNLHFMQIYDAHISNDGIEFSFV